MDDELEKQSTPNVNQPSSGTYGEKAAVANLESALPPMAPAEGGPAAGAAPQSGLSGDAPLAPVPLPSRTPPQQPGGIPDVLLGPTARPMEPAGAPVAAPLAFPETQQTSAQRRVQTLIGLSNDPAVSEETREWAQMWVKTLTSAST